jgi:hypothetical protein
LDSATQRSARSRLGGLAVKAQGKVNTATARQAFRDRFLDEVDPERVLPEKERLERAAAAYKLHFARMNYLAIKAKARRRMKAAKTSP